MVVADSAIMCQPALFITVVTLLAGCVATPPPVTQVYPPAPQHDDREWTDGTCCIEPGRCGGLNLFIPPCARNTSYILPPTRNVPIPRPPPPPTPPTAPEQPILNCWDGSICPGRVEQAGIQCCSARVMSGVTCAQIFICDKGRTCTGKETCYQPFESIWDVNNNGWELAGIVTFILLMTGFVLLVCCYCCCDRCIFNRRKYAADRERKEYTLQLLLHLSHLVV